MMCGLEFGGATDRCAGLRGLRGLMGPAGRCAIRRYGDTAMGPPELLLLSIGHPALHCTAMRHAVEKEYKVIQSRSKDTQDTFQATSDEVAVLANELAQVRAA